MVAVETSLRLDGWRSRDELLNQVVATRDVDETTTGRQHADPIIYREGGLMIINSAARDELLKSTCRSIKVVPWVSVMACRSGNPKPQGSMVSSAKNIYYPMIHRPVFNQ